MIIQLPDAFGKCRVFKLNENNMEFYFFRECNPREWLPAGIYFVDYYPAMSTFYRGTGKAMSYIFYSEDIDRDSVDSRLDNIIPDNRINSLFTLAEITLAHKYNGLSFSGGFYKAYFPNGESLVDSWGDPIPNYEDVV